MNGLKAHSGYVQLPGFPGQGSVINSRSVASSSSVSSSSSSSESGSETTPLIRRTGQIQFHGSIEDLEEFLEEGGFDMISSMLRTSGASVDESQQATIRSVTPTISLPEIEWQLKDTPKVQVSPDFLILQDADKFIYPPSLFALFSRKIVRSAETIQALKILAQCSLTQQARLPLFRFACSEYDEIVREAISRVLSSRIDMSGTVDLDTKRFIFGCAIQYRYQKVISEMDLNVAKVDLSGLDLRGISFESACCYGTNFSGCNLKAVDFTEAFCNGAQFVGCNLTGTNFASASLKFADFSQTNLRSTNFRDARTDNAKKDTGQQFSDVDTTTCCFGSCLIC